MSDLFAKLRQKVNEHKSLEDDLTQIIVTMAVTKTLDLSEPEQIDLVVKNLETLRELILNRGMNFGEVLSESGAFKDRGVQTAEQFDLMINDLKEKSHKLKIPVEVTYKSFDPKNFDPKLLKNKTKEEDEKILANLRKRIMEGPFEIGGYTIWVRKEKKYLIGIYFIDYMLFIFFLIEILAEELQQFDMNLVYMQDTCYQNLASKLKKDLLVHNVPESILEKRSHLDCESTYELYKIGHRVLEDWEKEKMRLDGEL
jgi:hypothetical protein